MEGRGRVTLALSTDGAELQWVAASPAVAAERVLAHGTEPLGCPDPLAALPAACRRILSRIPRPRRTVWVLAPPDLQVEFLSLPKASPQDQEGMLRSECEKAGIDWRRSHWGTRVLHTENRQGVPWIRVMIAALAADRAERILRALRQGGLPRALLVPVQDLLERSTVSLTALDQVEAVVYPAPRFTCVIAFDGRKATYLRTLPPLSRDLQEFLFLLKDYRYHHQGREIRKVWCLGGTGEEPSWFPELPLQAILVPRPAHWLLVEAAAHEDLLALGSPRGAGLLPGVRIALAQAAARAGARLRERSRAALWAGAAALILGAAGLAWLVLRDGGPGRDHLPGTVAVGPEGTPLVFTGTLEFRQERFAVLSKRLVAQGEALDGFTVLEIRPGEVVLVDRKGKTRTLRRPGGGDAR